MRKTLVLGFIVLLAISAAAVVITSYSVFDRNSKKMQAAMEDASPLTADQMFAIQTSVNASKDSLLQTGLYIVAAVCALAFLLGIKLTKPLGEVRKGARAISGGDLDYEFPSYADKELWDICAAFSDLAKTFKRQARVLALKELFINKVMDPFWIIDPDFAITDINPAFENLFGYSRQDVIGSSVFELMDEDDERALRKKPFAVAGRINEISMITKSGDLLPVQITWFPVGEEMTITPGAIGVIRDNSREHSLKNSLAEAGEFSRTLMDAMPEPAVVLDRHLNIVSANKAARESSGYELSGKNCSSLFRVPPASCSYHMPEDCPVSSVFSTGAATRQMHEINDGRNTAYYEMAAYPVKDPSGQVKNVLMLVQDISGRKKFENEIAVKTRELTALLGVSRLLNKTLVWDEIFSIVLDNTVDFSGMDGGCVFTLDDAGKELSCRKYKGLSDSFGSAVSAIRIGEDIPGRVAATGQAFTTSDLAADRRAEKSMLRHTGIKACAVFPIKGKEKTLGVFIVFGLKSHTFSASEENVLGSIGEISGMAFENVRLYERMKLMYQHQKWRKAEDHRELARMASALSAHVDLKEMLKTALDIMKGAVMADFIWLLELDADGNLHAKSASSPDIAEGARIYGKDERSLESRALSLKEPVLIPDLDADGGGEFPECLKKYGFEAACAVPVLSEGIATSVIGLYFTGYRRPTEEDISFLQTTTSILDIAVRQARAFGKIRRKAE